MKYYAIYNTKTQELSKAQCRCLNEECINLEISKEIFDDFEKYIYQNGELVINPNYESEHQAKEQERIAMLSLTAADVERGIYKAKGLDFDDIIAMVQEIASEEPRNDDGIDAFAMIIDVKALKIELKANNFYRGNPYVDAVGTLLGFTKEQLDAFFETGDYAKLCTSETEVAKDETTTVYGEGGTVLNENNFKTTKLLREAN
ncbi:hypothetical protein IJD15_02650 [bacterium]|nr:hypothetical protein [bacterium]